MRGPVLRDFERELARPAPATFTDVELAGLPEPVARYFRAAIAPGTPLANAARIEMRGRIKVGRRWIRFSGAEIIDPGKAFLWAVRAGPISGYDTYVAGQGEMRWKLLGLVPVLRASGPDVSRSAAARVAGEGVWIPTALLPRFGFRWSAVRERQIVSESVLGGHRLAYHHELDDSAHIAATRFERWGDPDATGTFAQHAFGVETTAVRRFGGLTIPAQGRAGWHYGTDRWPESAFFEYEITDLRPCLVA